MFSVLDGPQGEKDWATVFPSPGGGYVNIGDIRLEGESGKDNLYGIGMWHQVP